MGEGIPLRWLKFEKAKGARKEGMLKISQVTILANTIQVTNYYTVIWISITLP